MARLPRRERERRRHRREMLEAAEKLFSAGGYHGTAMQEIAEAAEFSVGALYNMFDSKEDLYLQLIEMRLNDYLEAVEKRMGQASDPLEKVRTVLAVKLQFFREHKRFFLIFRHELGEGRSQGPPVVSRGCKKRYYKYQEDLKKVFHEGIQAGEFVDVDPLLMVLCLEGTTNAVIDRWIHTGGEELDGVLSDEVEVVFFHGFLAREEDDGR